MLLFEKCVLLLKVFQNWLLGELVSSLAFLNLLFELGRVYRAISVVCVNSHSQRPLVILGLFIGLQTP